MKNRKSILIVDDNIAHRTMLRIFLDWQYDTFEADDGSMAIEAVNSRRFDLILMDARMMPPSGLEALEEIKALNPAIPVIMMSAHVSQDVAGRGHRKGAFDYIGKPLNFEKLRLLISDALASANTQPPTVI